MTILDAALPKDARPSRTCAVFILPSGRESEYQFATSRGLLEIAGQADCRRLITVRLNKPHRFPGMKELQAELNAIVLSLVPNCMDPSTESIPYMALGTDSTWTEVEYGYTVTSGDYVVEERPGRSEEDSDTENADQAPDHSILR